MDERLKCVVLAIHYNRFLYGTSDVLTRVTNSTEHQYANSTEHQYEIPAKSLNELSGGVMAF